jgi:hypothetical protein
VPPWLCRDYFSNPANEENFHSYTSVHEPYPLDPMDFIRLYKTVGGFTPAPCRSPAFFGGCHPISVFHLRQVPVVAKVNKWPTPFPPAKDLAPKLREFEQYRCG